jgi:anti-sigma regulatory factor (Ser/Thr protein kinase)
LEAGEVSSGLPKLLAVTESSQVAEARQIAVQMALGLEFSEERTGAVAIAVTEAAANLVKHAHRGYLQLRTLDQAGGAIELLAMDAGPGMREPEECLGDGFSTAGTSGTGLGAIRRLSAQFDLYSQLGHGTVLLGRVAKARRETSESRIRAGIVQVPATGETVCGDASLVVETADAVTMMVADGLGHGLLAAEAAHAASRAVSADAAATPAEMLGKAHSALRHTRGAALAIAQIDFERSKLQYAGVGNISGLIRTSTGVQRLVSHNGTAGAAVHRIQQFEYAWPPDALLIMHSDGLSSNWDFTAYPGLTQRDPSVIAAVLYRDFNRGRDDATVAVLREIV